MEREMKIGTQPRRTMLFQNGQGTSTQCFDFEGCMDVTGNSTFIRHSSHPQLLPRQWVHPGPPVVALCP